MFASDSVINLRSRKRPRHPHDHGPAGTTIAAGTEANPALISSDPLATTQKAQRSSILPTLHRKRPSPVLPIEKLRAQVANKRKRESSDIRVSPISNKATLKGSIPTAAVLSTHKSSSAMMSSQLSGTIHPGNGLLVAASSLLGSTSRIHQRHATAACQHPQPKLRGIRSVGAKTKQRRTVRFDLERNAVHEITKTSEDLSAAWMSRQESDTVRQHIVECIVAYQVGVFDHDGDTLRGLEVHLDPELMHKKIDNCRNYTSVILEQQRFLVSIMGHCNESILSRMSALLSDEDRQMSLDTAAVDALEASRIHGLATPLRGSAPQDPSGRSTSSSNGGVIRNSSPATQLMKLDRPPLPLSGVREAGGSGDSNASPLAVDYRAVQYVLLKAQAS